MFADLLLGRPIQFPKGTVRVHIPSQNRRGIVDELDDELPKNAKVADRRMAAIMRNVSLNDEVSIPTLMEDLGWARNTVHGYLKRLVAKGDLVADDPNDGGKNMTVWYRKP